MSENSTEEVQKKRKVKRRKRAKPQQQVVQEVPVVVQAPVVSTPKRRFSIWWPNIKKGQSLQPYIPSLTSVTVSGILITCILLSLCSGFVDLVFFSGISKSRFTVFGSIPVAAGILYTMISIGLISAKFWCATWLGAIKELQNRFKLAGFEWYHNLDSLKFKWSFAHKFLILISIVTSISLSVVSVGDAIRRNQNVIKQVNTAKERIEKYANTTDASDEMQFTALLTGTAASSTAGQRAAELAAKVWPIIEEYRTDRSEFEQKYGATFSSKEDVEWKGEMIIPDSYWDKQNSLVQSRVKAAGYNLSISQIRNITSEAVLATRIKEEIEASIKNNSLGDLTELSDKTKEKAIQEIRNLEGKFFMPGSEEPVVFDENNISGALSKLSDIKAAYENDGNGDVGDSAKMFMLIGPSIDKAFSERKSKSIEEAYTQKISLSSFGATEIMIMIFIMVIGFAQELLIALFTPKATIDRKMLSKFDSYFGAFDVDRFLIGIYIDYLEKGIINQADFDAKVKKCVTIMERNSSIDAVIDRFSTKTKVNTKKADEEKEKVEKIQTQVTPTTTTEKTTTRSVPDERVAALIKEIREETRKEV